MKKIIFGGLLVASSLLAQDTVTLLPYYASLDYDDDSAKSAKKDGDIVGTYASVGNLSYLLELDYSHTDIEYKDTTEDNLVQDDMTVVYSKYYTNYMFKGGIHHISTTDTDLGDGTTLIIGIGGYNFAGYSKQSYGIDGYISGYKDGYDDQGNQQRIKIFQITPYYQYSKAINFTMRNNIALKVNYVQANDYDTNNYTSFEIEDTIYYNKFSTTFKAYGGKMKSGVKDGGFTVYNNKDLIKDGYSVKIGYTVNKNVTLSAGYAINNFEEANMSGTASNDVMVATLSYTF